MARLHIQFASQLITAVLVLQICENRNRNVRIQCDVSVSNSLLSV
jgi:hypothetical protein